MMLDVIKNRRSTRSYLPEQIKEAELAAVLEAAIYAPSGHNSQPWHFTVIQNKTVLDAISRRAKEAMLASALDKARRYGASDKFHLFYHAPTAVIVSGDTDAKAPLELPGHVFSSYTPLADCSAAIENMLLAAESIGLGSCWVGLVNYFFALSDGVAQLQIPPGYQPLFAVCLGYKAAAATVAAKRKENSVTYIR
ncbi:MAG: nitroreductase family protein [Sporomusaceae bacterium]|nr:nitroreductase family protein [Sporomusaceae bacterium]